MNKKILLIFAMIFLAVILISFVNAFCCEKVKNGAFCMDVADDSVCDSSYDIAETACESTTYCTTGTNIDSEEGTCFESTRAVSEANNGHWDPRPKDEIPQCNLGCCIIGNGASFVTQARCNALSEHYGASNTFNLNVQDSLACAALATPEAKGACVLETSAGRTCTMETKESCLTNNAEFHVGYLCTAFDLNTNCAKTKKTACVEGRDEVFYLDSCGNLANIYDFNKYKSGDYWTYIVEWEESCGADDLKGNANSKSCGNCDYLSGSTCAVAEGDDQRPNHGINICQDLSCKYKGEKYDHGETWCITNTKSRLENTPGSEYFQLSCYDGEVLLAKNCEPARQGICIDDSIEDGTENGFQVGACRINRWQECWSIDDEEDCERIDRHCEWWDKELFKYTKYYRSIGGYKSDTRTAYMYDGFPLGTWPAPNKTDGICVPTYTPGLNTNNPEFSSAEYCAISSAGAVVKFEQLKVQGWWDESNECSKDCEGLTDECLALAWTADYSCVESLDCVSKSCLKEIKDNTWKCVDTNCAILTEAWRKGMGNMCYALGDCGVKENYIGKEGYNTEEDAHKEAGGPVCSDGIDNDMDGKIDFPDDPECLDAGYYSEAY